jgi:hypothetical protein
MNIQGKPAELRFTVEVTRKETGVKETFEMVGYCTVEEAQALGAQEVQPEPKQE